jgi:hypothetical protein
MKPLKNTMTKAMADNEIAVFEEEIGEALSSLRLREHEREMTRIRGEILPLIEKLNEEISQLNTERVKARVTLEKMGISENAIDYLDVGRHDFATLEYNSRANVAGIVL